MSKPDIKISHTNTTMVSVGVICVATLSLMLQQITNATGQHRTFGNFDFIQYWSAFRLFVDGNNPYDPALMLELQKQVGLVGTEPVMMWVAPWVLLLMAPILWLPLAAAVKAWALVSISIGLLSTYLYWRTFSKDRLALALFLLGLATFFPFWFCISSGQLGALLLLAVVLVAVGLASNQALTTGTGIFLMLLKPHLFYLVFLLLAFRAIRARELKSIGTALGFLILFCMLTYAVSPVALSDWVASFSATSTTVSYVHPYSWIVPTLVGASRLVLKEISGPSLLPILLVPGLTAALCSLWIIRRPKFSQWATVLPFVTLVSYLTSPYGWIADQNNPMPILLRCLEWRYHVQWQAHTLLARHFNLSTTLGILSTRCRSTAL